MFIEANRIMERYRNLVNAVCFTLGGFGTSILGLAALQGGEPGWFNRYHLCIEADSALGIGLLFTLAGLLWLPFAAWIRWRRRSGRSAGMNYRVTR